MTTVIQDSAQVTISHHVSFMSDVTQVIATGESSPPAASEGETNIANTATAPQAGIFSA
jgi:hypothetical protein